MILPVDALAIAHLVKSLSDREVWPRFKALAQTDIREKGPGNLVTVADESMESALHDVLTAALPGSFFVGEEAVSRDEKTLNVLAEKDVPVWVIDPIDGTYNFAHGRSHFGVYVALVINKKPVMSWVFDVPANRMAIAQDGKGAFMLSFADGSQTPIHRAQKAIAPADMHGHSGGAQSWHFKETATKVAKLENIRSSLHDFIKFSTNEIDFILHKVVTPWDHSAGILLANEAGGFCAINNKKPFSADMMGRYIMLVTQNEADYDRLYTLLNLDALLEKMEAEKR